MVTGSILLDCSEFVHELPEDDIAVYQTRADDDLPGGNHLQQQCSDVEEVDGERKTERTCLWHQQHQ